jgi:POT family proton-dependent oligopeptide transporter
MQTHGLPNDLIWYFNPILVVLLLPFVQWMLSSMASRSPIPSGSMVRITIGCLFIALSIAYVAIVQQLIYNSGPCYEFPTECPAANGGPNEISVWLQFPAYFFVALGEILAIITAYKYAYDMAPASMKSLVQASLLLTQGLGALLCLAISPTARNPQLVIMYATIAGIMFLATTVFAVFFWNKDKELVRETSDTNGTEIETKE